MCPETEETAMNELKTYNPIVIFVYFAAATAFSCVFMHPICLAVSMCMGLVYTFMISRSGGISSLKFIVPCALVTAVVNAAFNHRGVTIIEYLPNGNPLTLEALIYGAHASVMIAAVICWFFCLGSLMTSDKVVYIFSRTAPSVALVFSMTLRFLPKISAYFKEAKTANRCAGIEPLDGNFITKIKYTSAVFSSVVTRTLENSIDTADSMSARGYGTGRRSSFAIYGFDRRDAATVTYILVLSAYIIFCAMRGALYVNFYPTFTFAGFSWLGISGFAAYFALLVFPLIIEAKGAVKWKRLKSKI